ncbi:hypothetical protein [Streptomyces sp. STCH 565 A]|uniref:hypothetical protein n=1 Tax=Streptomyces sp. STCH 565 A TaxID=2950532 RepID=UPI002074E414|nr:hypothetical protein [Streptomyces sp. STCH 565 A]MCM8548883.1 hypothetical protein [Streptomyces sp. STCH 565 A]
MAAISVGSVEVDIIPNTRGTYARLREGLVPAATHAGTDAGNAAGRAFGPAMTSSISDSIGDRVGAQIGRQIAARISASIRPSVGDGITRGGQAARPAATRQGEQTGGAFARSLRTRLEAAFRSMPHIRVGLDQTDADADLARLRARLESLSGRTIGIDIDAATARAQAADIEERLRRIGAAHPNVAVRADTARAIAELQALQAQIDDISRDPAHIRLETDGTFGQRLRAQVQAAEASLPSINITADSTAAEVEIARLRAQLTALRDVRIGVDMDAATATARIEAIQARLQALSASDADVQIRVDAGAATAQLAAFQAMLNRIDGQSATANVRVSGMQALVTAAIAFGPAIIPALPVVAAGLGAVTAAATAAAVGLGAVALVALPGIKDMGSALQAQKAAQDAAAASTAKGAQAAGQAAARASQMAGAQQSLATAHRNAARQIAQAQQGIADAARSGAQRVQQAEESAADAVRRAAEANRSAAQQVSSARRALADAVEQAADRQKDAAERVAQAEESLADAQKSVRRAQEDLTQARADAEAQLAKYQDRIANSKLSERDAVLDLQEAEAKLRAVQAAGAQVPLAIQQRTQLAYDQAVQRLKEQRQQTKDLTAEQKAAAAAGVDGSETVKAAQERLAAAEKNVTDQQKGLVKARQDAARQQVEAQQQITQAQERVAEASRNVSQTQADGARSVARAQRAVGEAAEESARSQARAAEQLVQARQSAADSIASAQRQVESASRSAAGGVDQAAVAQAKYQEALAKMTPAARETFFAFTDLKSAFSEWSRSLQPDVMPLFTRAIVGLKNSLPGLTPFVREAAKAIGGLQDRVSAGFKSPWWQDFKKDLQGSVGPAIEGLGGSFGRIFKGMVGVIHAFLPRMDSISERMQRITGRFADWGTNLKGSPEFEKFLQYASDTGPRLSGALGDVAGAIFRIGQALSPVSGPLLRLLGGIASAIGTVAEHAPWLVQAIWGVIVVWRLWTIGIWAFNAAMAANPITLIIIGLVALVAAIVYCYNRFEWFRNAVKAVWNGIKAAAVAVKDWLAGPFANFWKKTLPAVFKAGWVLVKAWVIYPIRDFFTKTIPGWGRFLRDKTVGFFIGMAVGALGAWKSLKSSTIYPIRDFFTKTIPGWSRSLRAKMVEAFVSAATGIKNAFNKIRGYAKDPVQYVVDVVYNSGIRGVWNAIAGAFGAKKLPWFKFASGGVMPGYTPGRDVHRFVSPTGGALELSGGEAIMRPEFTRAVGSGFVGAMNSIASSRGSQGVKEALAPILGGSAPMSTDRSLPYAGGGVFPVQRFADGGIFGWIKDKAAAAAGAGSKAWNAIKAGASWLKDGLESSARAGVKHVVDPLLAKFPGADTGFGKMIRKIPTKIIDALFGYSKEADKKGGGGIGGPKIQAALKWAKTQHGKPYQWGGNGNPSWDCSGFMSAIESVIRGQKPHRRWATMAFSGRTAPPGWVLNGKSPFRVGITNAGVGHTAGTIGKTNVESRGGDGVIVGSRARAYNDRLFSSWYGFEPGKYDRGGMLQPGFNLAYNGTGRPEPVLTSSQFNALARGGLDGGLGDLSVAVYVGDQQITDIARAEVRRSNGDLLQVLNAG